MSVERIARLDRKDRASLRSAACISGMLVLIALSWGPPRSRAIETASRASWSVAPTDDSFVRVSAPATHFDEHPQAISVTATGFPFGSPADIGYLRFDVGAISGALSGARLRLYQRFPSGPSTMIGLASTVHDDWNGAASGWGNELDLSYSVAPAFDEWLDSRRGVPAPSWIVFESPALATYVQEQIDGDGLVTFRLQTRSSGFADLSSFEDRENSGRTGHPPVLELDGLGPSTATHTATATQVATATATATATPTSTVTPASTETPTITPAPLATGAPSATATPTNATRATATATEKSTATATPTATATVTATPDGSATIRPSATARATSPGVTATPSPSPDPRASAAATESATPNVTATRSLPHASTTPTRAPGASPPPAASATSSASATARPPRPTEEPETTPTAPPTTTPHSPTTIHLPISLGGRRTGWAMLAGHHGSSPESESTATGHAQR